MAWVQERALPWVLAEGHSQDPAVVQGEVLGEVLGVVMGMAQAR